MKPKAYRKKERKIRVKWLIERKKERSEYNKINEIKTKKTRK